LAKKWFSGIIYYLRYMRALKYLPHYTVNDYQQWEGRWELIDGIPYAMSPSPVGKHQRLGTLLLRQIGNELEKVKPVCGDCIEVYELDWIITKTTVVRPDIAIICDKLGDFITSPPVLIIEIISPATALKDRQLKFDIYQEQGVKYYIVVDPQIKTYNIYTLNDQQYKEQKGISSFNIHDSCILQLDINKALEQLELK
jgi:Uma2 family endonuclease